SQMDNVTQQNAALVEEASAASKSMEQQSATLVSQIGYFRTKSGSVIVREAQPVSESPRAARPAVRKPTRSAANRGATPMPAASVAKPAGAPPKLARASGDDSVWQEF